MIYLEQQDIYATLTTWIYTSFWQLYAAIQSGKQGYIHWPKGNLSLDAYQDRKRFSIQPNMYDWYFIQPLTQTIPNRDATWNWQFPQPEIGQYPLMGMPLNTIKDFYKQHLHFGSEVEQRGQNLVQKYNINFEKTIGITWRGTDIYLDGRPYLPIEIYYPFIDEILEKEPNLRIACTAEEEGILDPLLQKYPNAFKITEFLSSPKGGKSNPERFTPISGFERGMQPALMVWFFSKCKYYIKNRSSSGAVASWISNGNIVCLAHNENLDYEKPSIIHPKTGEQIWPKV